MTPTALSLAAVRLGAASEPRSAEEVACLRALWSDGECPGRVYFLGDVVAICDSHEALRAERDALKLRVDGMRPVVEAAQCVKLICGMMLEPGDEIQPDEASTINSLVAIVHAYLKAATDAEVEK